MFSLVCALPSPTSAEGCPSLFGWFIGTTAQSDFSCSVHVRRSVYAPSRTGLDLVDQDVQEVSRFSCMLFLSVRGFSDYAGPSSHSRLTRPPCCLPPLRNGVGILIHRLFEAQ